MPFIQEYKFTEGCRDSSRRPESFIAWSERWQMNFNIKKCYELKITRKLRPLVSGYNIKGVALKSVDDHPYLGVHLSKDLRWNVHVAEISKKANQTLGFIRRNLGKFSQDVQDKALNH